MFTLASNVAAQSFRITGIPALIIILLILALIIAGVVGIIRVVRRRAKR